MNTTEATRVIRSKIKEARADERARLTELAETELQNLHEGNFARYKIRTSEFEAWLANWQ